MQNPKLLDNMSRHLTQDERASREKTEKQFKRDNVLLQIPEYLNDDEIAIATWNKVCEDAEQFSLLDNLDRDTLGTYCMIVSRVIMLRRKSSEFDIKLAVEIRQQEQLQLTYANKLGLTPESRARLAQKKATSETDPDMDLYG